MMKCSFGEGVSMRPDGINDLDPCQYDEVQILKNVTVHVLKCRRCGHVELEWKRQPDTEEIVLDDF